MKKIFKYPLQVNDSFTLQLPAGSRILHLGVQDGHPALWAEVHQDNPAEVRQFHCVGTGHILPEDDRVHLGTIIVSGWVWHYYESIYNAAHHR